MEHINQQFAEKHEESTPLERFEQLLDLMEDLADKHAVGEKGWHAFPQREVTISRGDDVETHTVQLFIFVPKPLERYEKASYSPSITMVLGSLVPEENTGKLFGTVEKIHIKKSFLEEGSPYYKDKRVQATADLKRIDEMFLNYKITLDTLRPTG